MNQFAIVAGSIACFWRFVDVFLLSQMLIGALCTCLFVFSLGLVELLVLCVPSHKKNSWKCSNAWKLIIEKESLPINGTGPGLKDEVAIDIQ